METRIKVSVRRRLRKKNETVVLWVLFVVAAQASDSGLTACFVPSREQVLMRCSLGKVRLEIQIPQQRTALHTKSLHHLLSIDIGLVLIAQRKEKSFFVQMLSAQAQVPTNKQPLMV